MILAVDVGNSTVRLALVREGEVRAVARLPARSSGLGGLLARTAAALAGRAGDRGLQGVGFSNVVPALRDPAAEILAALGPPLVEVDSARCAVLPLGYARPGELGPDRLANAVAARESYGAPCIVVDLGTALTLEVVDAEGVLRAGVIFPGPAAAAEALSVSTARLVPGLAGGDGGLLGDSTAAAVAAGLTHGYPALIEGLVARARQALDSEAPAVLTGGGSRHLQGSVAGITERDPHLTLRGIALIAALSLAPAEAIGENPLN